MSLPDFLVLGAARSATTSLHYYLEQHPNVSMSITKEPNFFAFDHRTDPPTPLIDPASTILTKSIADRSAYEHLFAHSGSGDVLGEASPLYLYVRETPEQIHRLIPDARLIAIVRNPVDRAYSHWLHIKRDRPEAAIAGFRAACEAEMAGHGDYTPYAGGSHVLRMGLYDVQLERYLDTFGPGSLLVLAYETLVSSPLDQLHRVCDHLGVVRYDFDTDVQYNRSGVSRGTIRTAVGQAVRAAQPTMKAILPGPVTRRLARLRAARDQPDAPPPIPDDLRTQLVEWFAPSVERLRRMQLVEALPWDDFG